MGGTAGRAGQFRSPIGNVTVSSTAIKLLDANPAREKLIVQEVGGTNAFHWGDQNDISSSRGAFCGGGETIVLEGPYCPTQAIYAIAASGDATGLASEVIPSSGVGER